MSEQKAAPEAAAKTVLNFTCATCRWHVPGRKLSNNQLLPGQCRRNPPTFTAAGSRWPYTEAHEWCGDHHRLWEETSMVATPPLTGEDLVAQTRPIEKRGLLGPEDTKNLRTENTPGAHTGRETGEPAEPDGAGNSALAEAGKSRSEIKPAAGSPAGGPLTSRRGRREA
jgi:hypothetical protein